MKLIAFAALLTIGLGACGRNPVEPETATSQAVLGKSRPPASPALNCSAQQLLVSQLIRRVEYYTTDPIRTTLVTELRSAYDALNPAACNPTAAIAILKEFIATVEANMASIPTGPALTFISSAKTIIVNLGGTV